MLQTPHTWCIPAITVRGGAIGVACPQVMSLLKLSAGTGYTYLTKQVAAHDATDRGNGGLGEYYSARGEAPGQWWGAGLAGLELLEGAPVSEVQMRHLFGDGRHPDADRLGDRVRDAGGTESAAHRAGRLGREFGTYGDASAYRIEVARKFGAHNATFGQPAAARLSPAVRAKIRTIVAREMFIAEHGRVPSGARELSGFIAQQSRPRTTAVAGFDLTFSPVKSVSALWAVTDPEVARQIEAAHDAAVRDTLGWVEREVAHTRRGTDGIQQVKTQGLVATMFTHRDSRAGDPDLHTHVAISNKVQDATGTWLALDGRVLFKAKVAASERYNTRLEVELTTRLGITFAARPGEAGKRVVREIDGIDSRLLAAWSRRRRAINDRRGQLAVQFQADHGRPPTPAEALALAQQATLETREAKHHPRSEAEQRAAWQAEAETVLGSTAAVTAMIRQALDGPVHQPPHHGSHHRSHQSIRESASEDLIQDLARRVVQTVQADRATWQIWHLRAEAERQTRAASRLLTPDPSAVDQVVDQVVHAAIDDHSVRIDSPDTGAEPAQLRRPDGTSVYQVAGATRYTSTEIMEAEALLLEAARCGQGRTLSHAHIENFAAKTVVDGGRLSIEQFRMVDELATSGARLQLALAPAGAGKTTAMAVLADAWRANGGAVIGLAPSAVAAHQLADAIGSPAETLSKFTHTPNQTGQLGRGTLVLIDEAGMAGTLELATAVDHAMRAGASIRLIGDDRQLAAVGAGGVLRDIKTQFGAAALTQVHRFTDPTEAAATLAVRDGDTSAVGFYADRNRVHVGDPTTSVDEAFRAWAADLDNGRTSLLLAPTRDLVTQLNTRARDHRLSRDADNTTRRPEIPLADGTAVSAGDAVITRHNDRCLRISDTGWVKNGDRWSITRIHRDGSLDALHPTLRRTVRLPADYVREHVQLGYATTIHGAQGTTVDTCHTVLTGHEDRSLLYVAMTRGRATNHVYLATGTDGDPHQILDPDAIAPTTALEVMATIIEREDTASSATTTQRENADPRRQLHHAALTYTDAVHHAAVDVAGPDWMAELDTYAEELVLGLTEQPAWPTLRSRLALHACSGHYVEEILESAVGISPLRGARDIAAILDARIRASQLFGPTKESKGPLPWLPAVPTRLREHPTWGAYLAGRDEHLRSLTDQIRELSARWTTTGPPTWATQFMNPRHADLRGDLAVWRAATDTPDHDDRLTGAPATQNCLVRDHQETLDLRVGAVLPFLRLDRATHAAFPPEIHDDPWHSELERRLAQLPHAQRNALPATIREAIASRPLPTEQPAAALWWRIIDATARPGPPTQASSRTNSSRSNALSRARDPWSAEPSRSAPHQSASPGYGSAPGR